MHAVKNSKRKANAVRNAKSSNQVNMYSGYLKTPTLCKLQSKLHLTNQKSDHGNQKFRLRKQKSDHGNERIERETKRNSLKSKAYIKIRRFISLMKNTKRLKMETLQN